MKCAVIIPAYNEASVIHSVIESIPRQVDPFGKLAIIVVNDGSSDLTAEKALAAGATVVLSHMINRGLGGALGTGLTYARRHNYDVAVTLDADGQHDPAQLAQLIQPIIEGKADVVIGSRLIDARGMPWYRVFGNWVLNTITFLLFGVWTTDSQSGYRAFGRRALQAIRLQSSRYEVSSEFFIEIRRHSLRFAEVPIRAIYTNYSLKKGQSNLNAFSIIRRLIFKKLFLE